MRVRYSETALRELDEIFAWIYERNRSAAAAVVERVDRVAALLEEFPFAGHTTTQTRRNWVMLTSQDTIQTADSARVR